ncbi:MAG: hypothetical protein LBT09_01990, partial [Planctomycetaceae bacterium]|nr:hypothetical protein [Planctomycetaceae bacterium]
VNSDKNNPKAQVGTTILSDPYQSKLLTVWRTLWIELDRMAKPVVQTTVNAPASQDGFDFNNCDTSGNVISRKATYDVTTHNVNNSGNWDMSVQNSWGNTPPTGSEPDDFDVANQPDYPDISLLKTAMKAACVDVNEATDTIITGWGLTSRRETTFTHNLTAWDNNAFNSVANKRDVNVRNDPTFWNICGLGTYEPNVARSGDVPYTGLWATGGGAEASDKGLFLIFSESKRDQYYHLKKSGNSPRPINELKQGTVIHEVLHLFDFIDISGIYNPANPVHVENGLIMTGQYYTTGTSNDWKTFSKEQVSKIQKKNNPQ